MSLPPYTPPTIALATKQERLLRFTQHTHDRPVFLPASLPKPTSLPSQSDAHGREMFESTSHNFSEPRGPISTSSPPVIVSRLRKASSSSPLDIGLGPSASEHDWSTEDEGSVHALGAKSNHHNGTGLALRPRSGSTCTSNHRHEKPISTGQGRGAVETETEIDEPPRRLPISRKVSTPPPLTPPAPLERLTPLLFQTFRLLSVVPALAGVFYHLFNIYHPQSTHSRLDHLVCLLWALLTAHQCLRLTTGLLTRWKTYYTPLSTLIRLLALQAICWPATQYTLVLFNHERRPVICWAIIGSTTCVSRSIQLWVTSNLWGPSNLRLEGKGSHATGIRWGPRRWDWIEVGMKCALPMGIVYFTMAWAEALRREISGC